MVQPASEMTEEEYGNLQVPLILTGGVVTDFKVGGYADTVIEVKWPK